MAEIKDIIDNIEKIYGSNNALNLLKDFERVIDELDIYVYDNWLDGELSRGPDESRYFVDCTFMWPHEKMPDPQGGVRLLDYGCKVQWAETSLAKVRKIREPDDIRPGTKKGKIDIEPVWMVKISMPKKLMHDINRGYKTLDKNKVEDILNQTLSSKSYVDQSEQQSSQEAPAQ